MLDPDIVSAPMWAGEKKMTAHHCVWFKVLKCKLIDYDKFSAVPQRDMSTKRIQESVLFLLGLLGKQPKQEIA